MFLDDTACNLASLNLMTFTREDGSFAVEDFAHAVRLWTIVLEISVLMAQFPSRQIAELSYRFRTLGLGYANLGGLLMATGMPYDSDAGRAFCAAVTALMTGVVLPGLGRDGRGAGPVPGLRRQPRPRAARHAQPPPRGAWSETEGYEYLHTLPVPLDADALPVPELVEAARDAWDDALAMAERHGFRNAQVTVIAPTGTIGLVMDCDTTGIEPDFALVKFKKLAGGGYFKIINRMVPEALRTLGYGPDADRGDRPLRGRPRDACGRARHQPRDATRQGLHGRGAGQGRGSAADRLRHQVCLQPVHARRGVLPERWASPKPSSMIRASTCSPWASRTRPSRPPTSYCCGTMTVEGAPHLQDRAPGGVRLRQPVRAQGAAVPLRLQSHQA